MICVKKAIFAVLIGFAVGIIVAETDVAKSDASIGINTTEVKGNCSCGGFATQTPAPDAEPLISQAVLTVLCTKDGDNTCRTLCQALATTTKAKGPEVLCLRLVNVNQLKFYAFYKPCDLPWTYIGLQSDAPLCCEDGKAKPCPGDNSTATATTMTSVPTTKMAAPAST